MKADAECSIAFADISPPQAFEDDAKRISVVRVAIHVCVYAYFLHPHSGCIAPAIHTFAISLLDNVWQSLGDAVYGGW